MHRKCGSDRGGRHDEEGPGLFATEGTAVGECSEAGSAELDPWGLKNWGMSSWAAKGRAVGWGCLCEVVTEAVRRLEDKDAEGQLCQRRDPLRSQGDLAWGWVSNERRHWLAVCLGASYSSQGCLFCQQSLSEVGRGFWGALLFFGPAAY